MHLKSESRELVNVNDSQCGKYRNLLSDLSDKNFAKVTSVVETEYTLNSYQRIDSTNSFLEREKFLLFHTMWFDRGRVSKKA